MALIKCVDCGKEVSDRAAVCPNCGCPIKCSIEETRVDNNMVIQQEISLEPTQDVPAVPETPSQEISEVAEVSAENIENAPPFSISPLTAQPEADNTAGMIVAPTFYGQQEDKNSKKILKISIAVVAVVVVLAIVLGVTYFSKNSKTPTTTNKSTTVAATQGTTAAPSASDDTIQYISDRKVQYDDIRQRHELFFGFKNVNEEYISANSGSVTVEIVNMAGEQVYSNTIDFTSADFGSWSNPNWDSSRWLACVYINDSDITTGSSDRGILTMSAVADGWSFDEHEINIYNLPSNGTFTSHYHSYTSTVTTEATCMADGVRTFTCSCGDTYTQVEPKRTTHVFNNATCTAPKTCKYCGVTEGEPRGHSYNTDGICYHCDGTDPEKLEAISKCSLSLPVLPKVVTDRRSNGEMRSSVYVTDISYEFNYAGDGSISLKVRFSGTKTFDENGDGQSDTCKIGWKLYDSKGNVYETGTFYSPHVANGESFSEQEETILYGYQGHKPDAYRLEILDVN